MMARMAPGTPITTAMMARTAPVIMAVFHVGVLVLEVSVDIVAVEKVGLLCVECEDG
jgi:hypothetical protein